MQTLLLVVALCGQVNGLESFSFAGDFYKYSETWELPLYTQYWYSLNGESIEDVPTFAYTVDGGTWDTAAGVWESSTWGVVDTGCEFVPVGAVGAVDVEGVPMGCQSVPEPGASWCLVVGAFVLLPFLRSVRRNK